MSDVTIESIAIEITASADKADQALEKLSKSLLVLKAAASGGLSGTEEICKNLKQLAEAAKEFQGIDGEKIKNTAEALKHLKSIGNIGKLDEAVSQMKNLTKIADIIANLPDVDEAKTKGLGKIANSISKIGKVGDIPDLSGFASQIQPVVSAANAISGADMSAFAANMQQLAAGLTPLENLQNRNFSSIVKALERLPNVAKNLSRVNISSFAQQIQQISTAIEPLSRQLRSLSSSISSLPEPVQQAVSSLIEFNEQTHNADDGAKTLGRSIKLLNFSAMYLAVKKVVNVLGTFVKTSNEYVENLNLFNVTMGEGAEEALNFANRVNELMGIDVSQWIQNQGYFKQLVSGFGMVEEKANLVSKNMTQLGYDISSYFNLSVEDAMAKLQSGLAGELEPLRRIGYALDVATLQQVAYNHGIEMNISNMTQAQKAQLRYIAIMEQSSNAMGDMARTIDSPANQLRILESRIMTLKRAIGDSLMPVISAALPYVTAFVKLLGEGFRALADLLGFKVPEFDYSDLMQKSNKDIAASFDDATAASKRFKGTLASIDQLNIIGTNKEKSGAGDFAGFDLDLELPSYDFLGNLQEETDKAYETLKKFWDNIKPIVEGIAAGIAAAFVIDKVSDFVTGVKNIADAFKTLNSTRIGKIASSIVATVTAFVSFKRIVKDLTTGKGSVGELAIGIGAVAAAVGVFIAVKNPLGAVLTVVGAIAGAVAGWIEGQKQLDKELADSITYADNGGIAIQDLTNGFSGYFDEITSHYSDILENTKAFEDNEAKINSAAGEIKKLTDKYIALGDEMTAEDAETLKSNLEIIANGVTESLGIGTQGIVEGLKGKFHDFAVTLGNDVDDMVGKFDLLESMGNEAVASIKKNANALVGKIMSGEDVAENMKKLNEEIAKMGVTDIGTKEQFSFNEAIKNMASGNIKLGSPEEAMAAIEDIQAQADAAKASIGEAQTAQLYELETLKNRYSTMVTESGRTVKEEFDRVMHEEGAFDKLFAQTRESMLAGFEADKNKIDSGVSVYMTMVKDQFDKSAEKYAQHTLDFEWGGVGDYQSWLEAGGLFGNGEEWYNISYDKLIEEYKSTNSDIYDILQTSSLNEGKEISKYLMEGMAKGIFENQELWYKALDAASRGAIDEVKEICGVASPSKVFAEIGGFLMKGLVVGIDKNQNFVLSSLDDTVMAMERQMSGVEFEIPTYTQEDVEKAITFPLRGTFGGGMQTMEQPKYSSVDSQAVGEVGRAFADSGVPLNIDVKVQSYVELDGEQVGQSVSNYQQRQMAYSNGQGY